MLSFLHKYGKNFTYSQNGEESLIIECWRRIQGITRPLSAEIAPQDGSLPLWMAEMGRAVEIGGHDGRFCANTALLAEHGWNVLFVEGRYDLYLKCKENWAGRSHVRSQCCYVDERNINAFVGDDCDLLSIDVDGDDYLIFCGLKAKPKIVIVEIDSSLNPEFSSFNADGAANYFAMALLGITKGYFLLCHTGNMIFVDQKYKDLFPEIVGDPLIDIEAYFNPAWLKANNEDRR
jgi:hypothetical protein